MGELLPTSSLAQDDRRSRLRFGCRSGSLHPYNKNGPGEIPGPFVKLFLLLWDGRWRGFHLVLFTALALSGFARGIGRLA